MRTFILLVLLVSSPTRASVEDTIYQLKDLTHGKNLSWSVGTIRKPTIVFFWTSWCTYCKQALAQLNDSIISYYDIVSISCDEDMKKALKAGTQDYRSYRPLYWLDKRENKANFVSFYPTLFIVMPGGKIDTVYEGSQTDKMSYFISRLRYLMNQGT